MSISPINNGLNAYKHISSGSRINSAADDPSGLAISQKLNSETKGISKGTENTENFNNLLRTAEGGAAKISDYLGRMRELTVSAANGILTDSDKQIIQDEITQLSEGIRDVVSQTTYNNQNLLDGSFNSKMAATGPDGKGSQVSIPGLSLSDLGIDSLNVLNNPDIAAIDSAIKTVSNVRSRIGSTSNGLDARIGYNNIARENTIAANSKLADADIAKELIELNKTRIIDQFKINMQKKQAESKNQGLNLLL